MTGIVGPFCPACGMQRAESEPHLCTLEVLQYCAPRPQPSTSA